MDPTPSRATAGDLPGNPDAAGDPAFSAVATAYYAKRMTDPDRARARSQTGHAITSTLAGGLVGLIALTNLTTLPSWVGFLGVAAFALWTVASMLYVRAVSDPYQPTPQDHYDREKFIRKVLDDLKQETKGVEQRRTAANLVSLAAAALTVATVFSALVLRLAQTQEVTLILDGPAAASYRSVCGSPRPAGTLKAGSLNEQFLEIEVSSGSCDGQTFRVPREQTLLISEQD